MFLRYCLVLVQLNCMNEKNDCCMLLPNVGELLRHRFETRSTRC